MGILSRRVKLSGFNKNNSPGKEKIEEEEDNYEQGSGLLSNIKNKFNSVKDRIFSIYLSEEGK